jgi:hypothetical protein
MNENPMLTNHLSIDLFTARGALLKSLKEAGVLRKQLKEAQRELTAVRAELASCIDLAARAQDSLAGAEDDVARLSALQVSR